jgi:hypothetical protein
MCSSHELVKAGLLPQSSMHLEGSVSASRVDKLACAIREWVAAPQQLMMHPHLQSSNRSESGA